MSSASFHKVICPECNKEQTIERYDSVNDYDYELFWKIANKSIFDYECNFCKEKIHSPYPLLFHKLGIRDIQIGYKIKPIQPILNSFNPMMIAMKTAMEKAGIESKDICEFYDNEDDFANRVNDFLD